MARLLDHDRDIASAAARADRGCLGVEGFCQIAIDVVCADVPVMWGSRDVEEGVVVFDPKAPLMDHRFCDQGVPRF